MNAPELPSNDRRAVPRHLRDTEHVEHAFGHGVGSRASDAPRVMGRTGILVTALIGLLAAAGGIHFLMRQPRELVYALPSFLLAIACALRVLSGLRRLP